jgi:hypothetical protein
MAKMGSKSSVGESKKGCFWRVGRVILLLILCRKGGSKMSIFVVFLNFGIVLRYNPPFGPPKMGIFRHILGGLSELGTGLVLRVFSRFAASFSFGVVPKKR